jgi:hypothetical protein
MARGSTLPALVLLAFACWPARADACRCQQQGLEAYYQNADIVFLADIVAVTTVTPEDGGAAFRNAPPRIVEAFKGAEGIRYVRTPASTAACGIEVRPGGRYWVFAQRRPGEPVAWIDSCNGSRTAGSGFSGIEADRVAARLREFAATEAHASTLKPHTNPACWTAPRRYHTGDPPADIAQKITLERTEKTPGDVAGVKSPNGAYAFQVQDPTAIQRPPRVATVTVDMERDYRLALRLHGVAEPVQPEWINEKLIFLRATWGRGSFTDLILDVEAEELIYAEVAWAGERLFEEKRGPCIPEGP